MFGDIRSYIVFLLYNKNSNTERQLLLKHM